MIEARESGTVLSVSKDVLREQAVILKSLDSTMAFVNLEKNVKEENRLKFDEVTLRCTLLGDQFDLATVLRLILAETGGLLVSLGSAIGHRYKKLRPWLAQSAFNASQGAPETLAGEKLRSGGDCLDQEEGDGATVIVFSYKVQKT